LEIAVGWNVAKSPKLDGLTGKGMWVTGKIKLGKELWPPYIVITDSFQLKEHNFSSPTRQVKCVSPSIEINAHRARTPDGNGF